MRRGILVLALLAFFTLRFLPLVMRKEEPLVLNQERPIVLNAERINLGEMRDQEVLLQLAGDGALEEVARQLKNILLPLQAEIPFAFPENYYNVLCIEKNRLETPYPFEVHKRLYLGEGDLGLPFYLDVRVFDLALGVEPEEIISWHLATLEKGSVTRTNHSEGKVSYIARGKAMADLAHGFDSESERGLFLAVASKADKLYICYASAPATTFETHTNFFNELILLLQ